MNTEASEKMYDVFEEMFPVHFSRFFVTDEEVNFINTLKNNTELFVFSGVLRDFLLQYNKETPRDFDFVVSEVNDSIKQVLSRYLIRKTQLGGYKCRINDKEIDIWTIQDTWAIKKYRPFYLQNYLPLTAFFNITAAVYNLTTCKLYIHDRFKDFLEDKKHRKLDIILEDNPFPALCVIKTIELMNKFNLTLSDELKEYLIRYHKVLNESDYLNIQLKHYNTIKYEYLSIQNTIESLRFRNAVVRNTTQNKEKSKNYQMNLFDISTVHGQLSLI